MGKKCPACNRQFGAGDYTTIIALGPGDDEKEQRKAATGRPYNAVAVEVHWTCATGEPAEEEGMGTVGTWTP